VQVSSQHPAGYDGEKVDSAGGIGHGWDVDKRGLSTCATAGCHGVALTGGTSGGPGCGGTFNGKSCHTNVTTTWDTDCTFCHGDRTNTTGNGAPPNGVLDATAATDPTVGAHQKHVTKTATHDVYDCTMCHVKPTNAESPKHIDGGGTVQATVQFTTLNSASAYSTTAYTCSNNYCHGSGVATKTSPAWTSTTALACVDGCHGGDPNRTGMSGEHRRTDTNNGKNSHKGSSCNTCHAGVVDANGNIINLALHVNGAKDVKFSGTNGSSTAGTYNSSNKTCSNIGCHGSENW
jgi:predicted CxxxxCH...CXXCH cytochrome family protein